MELREQENILTSGERRGFPAIKMQSESQPEEHAESLESLLEQSYSYKVLRQGDIVEGIVVKATPQEILIDVGAKSEGIVASQELDRLGAELRSQLKVGEKILVYVLTPEDRNGNIILSLLRAQLERDWRKAEELYRSGEIFEAVVAGFNKGGLIVRLGKVRGFVPASQLAPLRRGERVRNIEDIGPELVGKTLKLKVIELDRRRNRLILSERAAMREWRRMEKERLLQELQEGEVRRGHVISLCDFGAFVDLGGADGLIHLSELAWRRVAHPSEVLQVGQEVEVYVLNVDRERKRIGLSLKRLQPDPWTLVEERYSIGQLVRGTVTKLAKFGAFVRLENDDIEGLVHISELSDERITHPRERVKVGDELTLRVIRIDPEHRRVGLSLKQAAPDEYVELDWEVASEEVLEWEEEPIETSERAATSQGEAEVGKSATEESVPESSVEEKATESMEEAAASEEQTVEQVLSPEEPESVSEVETEPEGGGSPPPTTEEV